MVATKDQSMMKYIISKSFLEDVLKIFLENKRKGNLLHSCILNLFEMLTPNEMMYGSHYGGYMNQDDPIGMHGNNFGLGNNNNNGGYIK